MRGGSQSWEQDRRGGGVSNGPGDEPGGSLGSIALLGGHKFTNPMHYGSRSPSEDRLHSLSRFRWSYPIYGLLLTFSWELDQPDSSTFKGVSTELQVGYIGCGGLTAEHNKTESGLLK
jgi:hypothetical protein